MVMKRWRLEDWYALILLVILALIVVHAPLTVFMGSWFPDYALLVKAWKEMLMLGALVLMIVLVRREHAWKELFRDKLAWLVSAYVAVHLASLWLWNGMGAALAGLAIDLRYVAYFTLVYVLVVLYPRFAPLVKKIALVGAMIVIGFGTLQIVLPADSLKYIGYNSSTIEPYLTIDKNDDFVRLQSTLRGPNPYGAYAASLATIALAWLVTRRNKFDWRIATLGAAAVLGTYLSYARSAYIALAAGAGIVLVTRFGRKIRIWQWIALGIVGVVVVVSGVMLRDNDFVSNVVLHEDPQESGQVNSNDDHWSSLLHGLNAFAHQPLGAGIGSTGSASLLSDAPQIIENQYLLIAHEVGWIGLALFVAIFSEIMRRLWRHRRDAWALGLFASGVGLALIGLILPVWVDDTVSIVWWGLAGAVVAMKVPSRSKRL